MTALCDWFRVAPLGLTALAHVIVRRPRMLTRTRSAYRHWGCVTSKILSNMKNSFDEAEELDGFEDLNDEDQERVKKAWAEGHVAPEDIPESARKADGEASEEEEEDKPKKKAGKKKEEEDTGVSVFKFEYASSGRSKCKGAYLCSTWRYTN